MTTMTIPNINDVSARIQKVLSVYEQADGELQAITARLRPDDSSRTRRETMVKVRSILITTGKKRGAQVNALIKLAYARGVHLVEPNDKLDETDMAAVETLTEILDNNLIAAEKNVMRTVQNAARKMNLAKVSSALATNLEAAGLIDSRGGHWKLSAYAGMALRTAAHEALSWGTLNAMKNHSLDVIKVSRNPGTNSVACEEWDGGTFTISGNTERYKTLTATPPFHPNCEHYLYYGGD